MVLTKVVIEQRLADLNKGKQQTAMQIEQMKANLIATDGAIQDCEHWLKELEVEEKKED